MSLQYIHDNKGNTTGVFIPIEEWQYLKGKYTELQKEENNLELEDWNKKLIDERLNGYYTNTDAVDNFDNLLNDSERKI